MSNLGPACFGAVRPNSWSGHRAAREPHGDQQYLLRRVVRIRSAQLQLLLRGLFSRWRPLRQRRGGRRNRGRSVGDQQHHQQRHDRTTASGRHQPRLPGTGLPAHGSRTSTGGYGPHARYCAGAKPAVPGSAWLLGLYHGPKPDGRTDICDGLPIRPCVAGTARRKIARSVAVASYCEWCRGGSNELDSPRLPGNDFALSRRAYVL